MKCSRKWEVVYNMNRQECDVLCALMEHLYSSQRSLSEHCGHSLGIVNRSLKQLKEAGFLNEDFQPTTMAIEELQKKSPKNAVILAAGFCMRMVPINMETSKAFLEVNGEPLIERLIKQLHAVGIADIQIVVGFMKESFEYLIDAYGVDLVVNTKFAEKNNLHSLKLVSDKLFNTYIIPCDIWCRENPFRRWELYSWYMVNDVLCEESDLRVNRNMELVPVQTGNMGNTMIGIAYLQGEECCAVAEKIKQYSLDRNYDKAFWEAALYEKKRFGAQARLVSASDAVEINTYEQLRELDQNSNHLKSNVLRIIADAFGTDMCNIRDITILKKGMTNRSFLFSYQGRKYIMRIPGEGTDQLLNRQQEADVYHAISEYGLCDNIVYINPKNGYKITEYFDSARTCDCTDAEDVRVCMKKLRQFHELGLKVDHTFDIFGQIDFYESLRKGTPSFYRDYDKTKEQVLSLKAFIDANAAERTLTHIDAVPDNFLLVPNAQGQEDIYLIDWEYAGMQDPHVDIAMFCIYALYNREQVENLIDSYFTEGCSKTMRTKIYCYISACGLLWSNWCEYKRMLGVDFGEYSLQQYRYAKSYYRLARESMEKLAVE